jgi:hypothetical protein
MHARNNVRLHQRTGSRSFIGHLYCMARNVICTTLFKLVNHLEFIDAQYTS